MTIQTGIIGAGRIGKVHAETLVNRLPDAEVLVIADVVLDAANSTAQHLNIPLAVDDPQQVIDHPDVEAVVICSSTDTHAEFIIAAAQAGKHIFCEKPIDLELKKIDEALEAVDKAGVKFQVGFNRRFDANHARVRQAVESNEIGTPQLLHIISRDPDPPGMAYVRVSGGMFLDMTIHDFDMARFLMGVEVEEIYVAANVLIVPALETEGDVDTALITLKFANGAMGVIDNSRRAAYGYDQRVEILGSEGSVRTENRYPSAVTISDSVSVRHDLPYHFFMDRYTDSYITEMAAFIDAIIQDKPVPVSGLDGRIPVVMGLAAWKSYRENRPVRLDEIE